MSKDRFEIKSEEGNSPEAPKGFAATIWEDLIKGPTGREVLGSVKAEWESLTRGQSVKDYSNVSLNRMQAAWASSAEDVYND